MKNIKIRDLQKRNKEYQDNRLVTDLRSDFKKVLEVFIEKNYPNGLDEYTRLCSIHDLFSNGHNCVACNLQSSNKRIEKFLLQYKSFSDIHLTFTNYILLLYLQVESFYVYFHILGQDQSYKPEHFKVFQEIKRWANFLKHPKAFMLVHHPIWVYEGMPLYDDQLDYQKIIKAQENHAVIDDAFVQKYYGGGSRNDELYRYLEKKEDMVVAFPDPIILINKFTVAQESFVYLISSEQDFKNILQTKATIEYYFSSDNLVRKEVINT